MMSAPIPLPSKINFYHRMFPPPFPDLEQYSRIDAPKFRIIK
jgi:hypothetical protein